MVTDNQVPVSVIIPCRNEKGFIGKCLDSILSQDYSKDMLEVLVVDGMSEDGTIDIIREYSTKHPYIKLLRNKGKIVPTAMNIGIQASHGEIIIRMDAHNEYEGDYVSKCVKYLTEYDADNVGGVWVTLSARDTLLAHSIALALSHAFGVGNSYFRIGAKEPRFVDTVPFGCFRREVFEKVGLFDEDLVRNQDDEFNLRLIKNGGKILLAPEIVSRYYARDSLSKLWKMYYQYGYFKPLVARKVGGVLTARQLAPGLFVSGLIGSGLLALVAEPFLWLFIAAALSYLAVNIGVSSALASEKGFKYVLTLPVVFTTLHFSYGLGYLNGILDFILLRKDKKRKIGDVPLTR
jgi:glycosyltransferase involved in cell wall biosynthesis